LVIYRSDLPLVVQACESHNVGESGRI